MRDRKQFLQSIQLSQKFSQLRSRLPQRIITSKGEVRKQLCPIGSFIVTNAYESRFMMDKLIQQHDLDILEHQLHSLDLQVRSLANESIKATLHKVRHGELPSRFSTVCYGSEGIASTLSLLNDAQQSVTMLVHGMQQYNLPLSLEHCLLFEDVSHIPHLKEFQKTFSGYVQEAKLLITDCHEMLHSRK